MSARAFLTAEWRHLVMLNFAVDPAVLKPFVPAGTELDFFGSDTFVSVVGFRFLNTRVLGWAFPFHRNFEEVNLRFYVRRKTTEGWRRGVVFISELVPRRAIAFVARTFYGEPYLALPMRHSIELKTPGISVEYAWRRAGNWESVQINALGDPRTIEPGSPEEFITEHYWGYTQCGAGCREYEVEHPRWKFWPASESSLKADVGALYGNQFIECLSARPASAFIADGSPVVVRNNLQVAPNAPGKPAALG
ncbi:MAG: hypothetical protein JWQ04_2850 [Pedosphaera sp.]|nr:hypothetical protein [Pedosphaera sp.]